MVSVEQVFGKPWTAKELDFAMDQMPKDFKPENLAGALKRRAKTWSVKKMRAISKESLVRFEIKPR